MLSLLSELTGNAVRSQIERFAFHPPNPPSYQLEDPTFTWLPFNGLEMENEEDENDIGIGLKMKNHHHHQQHQQRGKAQLNDRNGDHDEDYHQHRNKFMQNGGIGDDRDHGYIPVVFIPYFQGDSRGNSASNTSLSDLLLGTDFTAEVDHEHEQQQQQLSTQITILYSHGNAEDLGIILPILKKMSRKLKVNVVGYDYIGYGFYGKCSEENTYRSIALVYNWLTKTKKIPSDQILLYGRSLGGGPSLHLASQIANAKKKIRGLILQSTFMSAFRLVSPVSIFGDIFNNYQNIQQVEFPIFIIHGVHDEVVPISHAEALYSVASIKVEPLWLEAGHYDCFSHCESELYEGLLQFINSLSDD